MPALTKLNGTIRKRLQTENIEAEKFESAGRKLLLNKMPAYARYINKIYFFTIGLLYRLS